MNKIAIDLFSVLLTIVILFSLTVFGFAGFMLFVLSRTPV